MCCMSSGLVKRLAGKVEIEVLDSLHDRKDKLKSKIFMKKLEILFQESENMLHRCAHCSELFTEGQREWQLCEKAQIFIGAHGELQAPHVIDRGFQLNKFVLALREKKIPWQTLFWKLFSCLAEYECTECNQRFTGNRMNQCSFHPKEFYHTMNSDKG